MQITNTSSPAAASHREATDHHGFSFHDVLSALNPLQYLPVVGTIYRAVTGDEIPEVVRRAGSLLVSALLGGPVGVMIFIASTIAEKVTGIDPEKIVAAQFNAAAPAAAARGEVPTSAPASTVVPTLAASASLAMSPAQLAAYGVRVDASGTLTLGDVKGADVLNIIESSRLAKAAAAYAAN